MRFLISTLSCAVVISVLAGSQAYAPLQAQTKTNDGGVTIFSGIAVLHPGGGHELGDSLEVAGCTLSFVYQKAALRNWLLAAAGRKLTLEIRPYTYRAGPDEAVLQGLSWNSYQLDQKGEMLFMLAVWGDEAPSDNLVMVTTYEAAVRDRYLKLKPADMNLVFRVD